jgi:hypothetical protein
VDGVLAKDRRYPTEAVARVLQARGEPPLELMQVDARALARFFGRHPDLEAARWSPGARSGVFGRLERPAHRALAVSAAGRLNGTTCQR